MARAAVVVALLCLALVGHAAIIGIDLGSEFVKLAAPKNNDVDIVLNEQSNRKTDNFIGFRGEERYFGNDAKNLAPRFPDNMLTMVGRLCGIPHNASTHAWLRDHFHYTTNIERTEPTVNATRTSTSTLALRTGSNPNVAYTAETLQAMMFGFLRRIVRHDTGKIIRSAVVTVPAGFTRRQRRAIVDAGTLGGMHVVGTVHATSMAALQYGLQNRINGSHTVVVYDMGSTKTDVGVYSFAAPTKRGKKKNAEAMGTVTTRAMVSDLTLGGRSFDGCLAELIENRFVKEKGLPRVLTAETLPKRKAVIALMRGANKAKEVLSANKAATVTVEGVAPGKDFTTTITRAEFEEECAPLFKRAAGLAEAALAKVGPNITAATLDAFEIVGGGARIPRLLADLSAVWEGKSVGRTLNGDESAALGAAYYGGAVTGRFRMKFYKLVEDLDPVAPDTNITFALTPKPAEPVAEGEEPKAAAPATKPRRLFVAPKVGTKKTITVNRTEDFGVHLYVTHPGSEEVHDVTVNVTNVATQLGSVPYFKTFDGIDIGIPSLGLRHPNNTHTVRLELLVTESGLIAVNDATVRVTFAKNITRRVKTNLTEEEFEEAKAAAKKKAEEKEELWETERLAKEAAAKANATANATEGDTKPEETKEETKEGETKEGEAKEEAKLEAEGKPEANETATNKTKLTPEEKRAKSRAKRIKQAVTGVKPWKFVSVRNEEMRESTLELKTALDYTFPDPMSAEDYKAFSAIVKALDAADQLRRDLSKAKNDFETYILHVKMEGVLENEEMRQLGILTPEAEENVTAAAAKASEWLDEEAADDTPLEEYKARHAELKAVVKPLRKALKAAKKPKKAKKAKADDSKAEEPKTEEPKTEEKADDSKAEEPKADEAKAEESQPEDGEAQPQDDAKPDTDL